MFENISKINFKAIIDSKEVQGLNFFHRGALSSNLLVSNLLVAVNFSIAILPTNNSI
jgi:hypothetical protein